jgi:hypothetical protein
VAASIHRKFGKGRDPFYKTRQADYRCHEGDARRQLSEVAMEHLLELLRPYVTADDYAITNKKVFLRTVADRIYDDIGPAVQIPAPKRKKDK